MFWRMKVKREIKKDRILNLKSNLNIETTMIVDDKYRKIITFSKSCDGKKMPAKIVRL